MFNSGGLFNNPQAWQQGLFDTPSFYGGNPFGQQQPFGQPQQPFGQLQPFSPFPTFNPFQNSTAPGITQQLETARLNPVQAAPEEVVPAAPPALPFGVQLGQQAATSGHLPVNSGDIEEIRRAVRTGQIANQSFAPDVFRLLSDYENVGE